MSKVKLIVLLFSFAISVLFLTLYVKLALPENSLANHAVIETKQNTLSHGNTHSPGHQKSTTSVNTKHANSQKENNINERYIVNCESELSLMAPEYRAVLNKQVMSFASSPLREQKLVYALFSLSPALTEKIDRLELLFSFDKNFPNEPLILMDALNLCAGSKNAKCTDEFINYAIQADPQNGAMWLHALAVFASQGEDSKMFEAISRLEKANIFNERYSERILRFTDVMETSEANNFSLNLEYAIGVEAARFMSYSPVVQWCKEGVADIRKSSACLTLGRNIAERSSLALPKLIGLALEEFVYEHESNSLALFELEEQRQRILSPLNNDETTLAFSLLRRDEKSLRLWLANIESIGESQALKALVEEAIKVSHYVGEAYCNK
jgi:hypothetical protein